MITTVVKNVPANAGDAVSIPGLDGSPGEGNGNPLQYSCLGNPMDRGAWRATAHGVTKSGTRLGNYTVTIILFEEFQTFWIVGNPRDREV